MLKEIVTFDANEQGTVGIKNYTHLSIGDEVIVLYDRFGTGLFDINKIGKVTEITQYFIKVKGFIFSRWYPLNNFYIVCKIEK